ncbi:MAG: hypothetical protein KKD73_08095 [Proteobacteria bacterium]|nr:hypothetical protein [Pseudomonadota bacterium]MBU1639462.1 hypothetical protein [Pseudomonadota bacterium]
MMVWHMKKGGFALVLLMMTAAGCVASSDPDRLGSGQMAIEREARDCYEHAVVFMGEGHYLLARQQFSEAAAMAMSQKLHDDAVAGLDRVDKIIEQRR